MSTARPSADRFAGALRHLHGRIPLAVACAALTAFVLGSRSQATDGSGSPDLSAALAREGLVPSSRGVVWLEPEIGPLGLRALLFRAQRRGEPSDVYYAEARQGDAPDSVLDLFWLTNLTRSSSAAEGELVQLGRHVAFDVRVGDVTSAVVVLDTAGEPESTTSHWPWYARGQNAITNLQESGRVRGIGRRDYRFATPAQAVELTREQGQFVAYADGATLRIDPQRLEPREGAALVSVQAAEKGRPGGITWVVDTVRNLSFVGPEPIEWLEHKVFGWTDRASRTYHGLVSSDNADMQNALAVTAKKSLPAQPEIDPDLGWPPPSLAPVLPSPPRGEGEWVAVVDDAFVNSRPGAPPAFYQTFLRVDPERPYVSVFVTLWDPRQVQLHVAMGTAEPESATGETGTGLIPRDPEVLRRLVGAFNGGFQALHGEFGMMAEGRVYLPPKPWAATVGVYEDGRVEMGSWRGPDRSGWDEARANAQIPDDMTAMRQNLTSVVEDGRYNPWKRWWWGAAPELAKEQTFIARSGLCLTARGHMAFLWGESMGPDELGKAMLAAQCVRGIHLDMNAKHTGLELYRPLPPGAGVPRLGRALGELEFEGPIEHGLGFEFRSRLAVKVMSPLRFPRYLGRDPRDFFFLTLKSTLPGPALRVGGTSVSFSTAGLPSAGYPHALARAELPPSARTPRVWLVRLDPARAVAAPLASEILNRPLARLLGVGADAAGQVALFTARRHGLLRYAVGAPSQDARVVLSGEAIEPGSVATRALGVDREGFLLYAESEVAQPDLLFRVMEQAGATPALALADSARLGLEGAGQCVSVDGKQQLPSSGGLAFLAETRPAAGVMFPEVKPMPYHRWGFLQGQRVRYFPTGPPRFPAPPEVLAAPPKAAPPAPPNP